jgi:hypothetical protein
MGGSDNAHPRNHAALVAGDFHRVTKPTDHSTRKRLAAAALQLEPDLRGDFDIIAQISDPDGNRLTLAEPPQGL